MNLCLCRRGSREKQEYLLNAGLLTAKEEGGKRPYDRFRERLMFPIHDQRGQVVAFGGRVMEADAKPKYLNSPETPVFHKSRELYALHRVRKLRPAPHPPVKRQAKAAPTPVNGLARPSGLNPNPLPGG